MDMDENDRNKKNSVENWKILRGIATNNIKLFYNNTEGDIEKIAIELVILSCDSYYLVKTKILHKEDY